MKKKTVIIIVAGAVLAIAIAIVAFVLATADGRKVKKQLDLGYKYLQELDFEQAIASFKTIIAIDPLNVDAYLGMADAYIGMDDLDAARQVLTDGYQALEAVGNTAGISRILEKFDEIQAIEDSRIITISIQPILDLATIEGESILNWDLHRLVDYYGLTFNETASDADSDYYDSGYDYEDYGYSTRIYKADSSGGFDWRNDMSSGPFFRMLDCYPNHVELHECLISYDGSTRVEGRYVDYARANNVTDSVSFLKSLGVTDEVIAQVKAADPGMYEVYVNTEYGNTYICRGSANNGDPGNDISINVVGKFHIWVYDWADGFWIRVKLEK